MCDFCVKHGNGGRWFENVENYARKMFRIRKEKEKISMGDFQGLVDSILDEAINARGLGDPQKYEEIKSKVENMLLPIHFGQVVTLEEVEKILDIAYPIGRISCVCRRRTRGVKDEENFFCMGIGAGMYKWEKWPENYRGGIHFMSPKEAKEWIREVNRKGAVHSFWVFGTPYIGGICNCEYPSCIGMRMRLDYDVKILRKGEKVACVDYEKCNGCGACLKRCQFGAINYEPSLERVSVNQKKCFGCGLCSTACKPSAITMRERKEFPGLIKEW